MERGIVAFGEVEQASRAQLERCLDVSGPESLGVLCADHHKGYSMPIGGVVASQSFVMPAGVGYDIGCGNCAVQTPLKAADVDVAKVMDEIWRVISFGMGRNNDERVDSPVFDSIDKSPVPQQRGLLQVARNQLGTVGSGNHYVDLFEDRGDGSLWVGVHFGSRGFGHKTATGFLALAAGKEWGERTDDSMDATPTTIGLASPLGADYLAAMEIAGEYAYAGRNWVVDRVLAMLGTSAVQRIHNHHNFAWWESHFGQLMLVTRKGATPAFPGQRGFIGASMSEDAVIVEGVDTPQSAAALYSTVHGAGRVMSRMEAKKGRSEWHCTVAGCDMLYPPHSVTPRNLKCPAHPDHSLAKRQTKPPINHRDVEDLLKSRGIELRGAGVDEAPACYKRLPDVLAAHGDTIRILHTLRPVGVAMAGRDTIDPYKD